MSDEKPLSPVGRALVVLALLAAGAFPILGAFDLGPLDRRDINGPPWVAAAAGGVFLLAGLAIAVGQRKRLKWVGSLAGLLCLAALAAIGNWIAFGVGTRECSSSLSGVFGGASGVAGDLECRIAFGFGAVLLDGMLLWGLGAALGRQFGPGLVQRGIETVGQTILIVALSPLLLILVIGAFGKGLGASLLEYRKTGRWPRNERFIARMKARRNTQR